MTAPAASPCRVYIHTLGCPKNEADSRSLARSLSALGIEVADDPEASTHIVINSCGFIQDAKEESIGAILAACAGQGGRRVAVMGCLVQRYRAELEAGIPEVEAWFQLGEEARIAEWLSADRPDEALPVALSAAPASKTLPAMLGLSSDETPRVHQPYAYIKISDGCDEPCTFCAIPSIKGPYHSVDASSVLREVDACLRDGAREIVLVGQDTAVWRDDDLDLVGLLSLLVGDERLLRLRLMYLQPEHVTDELLTYMAGQTKVCRYLDIPFQHAAAAVLKRMGRWGDDQAFRALVDRARRLMPDVSLRSTFIVGFPGETEEQFEALLEFVDYVGFDHAGGFIYSPEEGTRGASLRPRVRRSAALERLNRLSDLIASRAEAEHRRLVGTSLEAMIDELVLDDDADVTAVARVEGQAPEIDGVTYIEGDLPEGAGPGDLVMVTVTDAVAHDLIGRCDAP